MSTLPSESKTTSHGCTGLDPFERRRTYEQQVLPRVSNFYSPIPKDTSMEHRILLGLLPLLAAVPILGQSAQSLASHYFDSPTRSTSENLSIKRYVTAGDRAYEVGTLDGAFPKIGWHVNGHMNGVWAHPIKLLDSYRFLINGQPFPSANRFTSGAGYIEFEYPEINSLGVTRTVFAPDGMPAVLVGLSLRTRLAKRSPFGFCWRQPAS